MPRLMITVSKRMDKALKDESDKTHAPVAALIREAIEEWAKRRGIDVKDDITWGGARLDRDETPEGQLAVVVG